MEHLATRDFLTRLRQLRERLSKSLYRLDASHAAPSGKGVLPEVETHRPYALGDDPRHIDWNLYARFDRFFVKSMLKEEEGLVLLLVDTSRSMRSPYPEKERLATEVAAALGYLYLCAGNRVGVVPWAERIFRVSEPVRGEAELMKLLRTLSGMTEGTTTDLGKALAGVLATGKVRHAAAVVVSDFIDPGEYRKKIDYLVANEVSLGALQILHPAEKGLDVRGNVELVDPESGLVVRRVVGYSQARELRRRVRAFLDSTAAFLGSRAERFALTETSVRFETAVERYLVSGRRGPAK